MLEKFCKLYASNTKTINKMCIVCVLSKRTKKFIFTVNNEISIFQILVWLFQMIFIWKIDILLYVNIHTFINHIKKSYLLSAYKRSKPIADLLVITQQEARNKGYNVPYVLAFKPASSICMLQSQHYSQCWHATHLYLQPKLIVQ